MSAAQRKEAMALRRARQYPWHGPPHFDAGEGCYHVWAACYEHRPVIGRSVERMTQFELALLDTCGGTAPAQDTLLPVVPSSKGASPESFVVPASKGASPEPFVVPASAGASTTPFLVIAWCVLPNHYHLLLTTGSLRETSASLGRVHGRFSYAWNGEEGTRGRKVWHRCSDRAIRSDRHFWATMNYIHHNPVKHGYASRWQDWPYSSAGVFLEAVGKESAEEIWREYPLLDYGKGWDEFD